MYFDMMLKMTVFVWQRNSIIAFDQQWNETVQSFIHLLNFREKPVLIKWRIFSSAIYVRGFYYVVVDFLRGSEAEKNIFEKRYKIFFFFDESGCRWKSE